MKSTGYYSFIQEYIQLSDKWIQLLIEVGICTLLHLISNAFYEYSDAAYLHNVFLFFIMLDYIQKYSCRGWVIAFDFFPGFFMFDLTYS